MPVVDLRYARALSAVISDQHLDPIAIKSQLDSFIEVLDANPELRKVLEDPSIPEAQKFAVLNKIQLTLGSDSVVRNFIAVLVHNHRLQDLGGIVADYSRLRDEQLSVAEATVVSARPVDQANRDLLEQRICTITGSQRLQVTYSEDQSLIGGLIVTVGSTVYDGSVRTQLNTLKTSLLEAGS
ncbi:MAG: ATP synthase F1 subunit delta [Acidobacteria bacterium]|nr:ATP synthase F1 subunit delta [Acidobacteriota bacterium]